MARSYPTPPNVLKRRLRRLADGRRRHLDRAAERTHLLRETLEQAQVDGYSLAELCREAGVSRETFYLWRREAS